MHLLPRQAEVEDREVLPDRLLPDRLGQDHEPLLHQIAQRNLGRALAVRRGHGGDGLVLQEIPGPERAVRLQHHPPLAAVGDQGLLPFPGEETDLVDHRGDLGALHQLLEVPLGEVRDPDALDHAGAVELLDRPPGACIGLLPMVAVCDGVRPVDQVEVDVVDPQGLQALLETGTGQVVAVVLVMELGGEEDLASRDAALGDALPHALLVEVRCGGIDVSIPRLQGQAYAVPGHDAAGDLPGAESDLGDLHPIAHGDFLHTSTIPQVWGNAKQRETGWMQSVFPFVRPSLFVPKFLRYYPLRHTDERNCSS